MQEFSIRIRSFQEIQDFIQLATAQPFRVQVSNDHQIANATSFMALVSLDHSRPVRVSAQCDEQLFRSFRLQAARFAAE